MVNNKISENILQNSAGGGKWFPGIQSLRALLFILVLISHSATFFTSNGIWGAAAVDTFFVMSGFLSARGYNNKTDNIFTECLKSLWKKIKTFYPLYFVFLLIFIPIKYSGLPNIIKCLFLTQSYWLNANTALSYNWPTWFLSSIMLSYFLQPVLVRMCKKVKKYSLLCIVLIFIVLCLWSFVWIDNSEAYGMGYYYVYICPLTRMFDFIIGIFAYLLFENCANVNIDQFKRNVFDGAVLVAFIVELALCDYIPKIFQYTVMWIPVSILLVLIFATNKTPIISWLSNNNFLQLIGKLSFELYIIHRVVLICFGKVSTSIVYWLFAIVVTFVIASIAHEFSSKYILKSSRVPQK